MNSYLKLLPSILVNERATINRVFFYFSGKRHRTRDHGIIPLGGIHDLFDGTIENFAFIGPDTYAQYHFGIALYDRNANGLVFLGKNSFFLSTCGGNLGFACSAICHATRRLSRFCGSCCHRTMHLKNQAKPKSSLPPLLLQFCPLLE